MSQIYELPADNPFRSDYADFVELMEPSPWKTFSSYTKYVGNFLDWVYLKKHVTDLEEITWKDYREYQKFLSLDLKGNSVNQQFSAIKKFYVGILDKQWNSAAVPNLKYDIFRGPTPVQAEVDEILRSIDSLNDWLMIALMAYCGLRKEELVSLHYSDIRRIRGTLYVAPSKNHEDREVPLSPVILGVIERYYRALPDKPTAQDYIFPGMKEGSHLSENTVNNRLDRILEKLHWENRGYTPHSFRRFFGCSQYLAHPDDLPRLQALMGHRCLSSTMVYIKLAAAFKARMEDNERVNNLLKGVVPGCAK